VASTPSSRSAHQFDSSWIGGSVTSVNWGWNQKTRRDLMFSRDNLSRFLGNEKLRRGRTPNVQALLADYDALIQETQVIGLDMQGQLAMEETKRGIAQADAVRR
jgi:hypothetical protein